ncbi:MAG: hypothetical protein JW863_00895 [Chitinispirillaceae bacterium]|nr:hypothetical protein [Chitinispirillaceae bacterium]
MIKYVFCINPGRCGSDYLTEIFLQAVNTTSYHENTPIMNGIPMREYNNGNPALLEELMPAKVKSMRKNGTRIYCETNHSFIKGWGWLLPDTYLDQKEIGVVILKRDPEKICRSLLRVHEIPGLTEWSRTWYLVPGSKKDLVPFTASQNKELTVKWYIEEVCKRAELYRNRFPDITYVECDLEELNDYDYVLSLFNRFGIKPGPSLRKVVGKRWNARSEWPRLPLEELLAQSDYRHIDTMEPVERDNCIADILDWIFTEKHQLISGLKRDMPMVGTYWTSVVALVAGLEQEIEKRFEIGIRFSETEYLIIYKILKRIDPLDISFAAGFLQEQPHLSLTYNYNWTNSVKQILKTLGVPGLLHTIWLMLQGAATRDGSHRAE